MTPCICSSLEVTGWHFAFFMSASHWQWVWEVTSWASGCRFAKGNSLEKGAIETLVMIEE